MKRFIPIISIMLTLSACQSTKPNLIQTKMMVVTPPPEMYQCPIERNYPRWETLNDVEVAKTLLKLHKNNLKCKNSIDAIKKFLDKAKVEIEH